MYRAFTKSAEKCMEYKSSCDTLINAHSILL